MSDEKRPTIPELEEFILSDIRENLNLQIGVGQQGMAVRVRSRYTGSPKPTATEVTEAVWSLIARGLAYIDFSNADESPMNTNDSRKWWVYPTARAKQYARDELPSPDVPDKYLKCLFDGIPQGSNLVELYIREALQTYANQNYIASAVMLGVASEAAFLEMAEVFCDYLPNTEGEKLRRFLESPKSKYSAMLDEFRKRFDVRKGDFPPELADNIDLQLNSVLDLIRRYRNDSGHPSGFQINRAECHQSLVCFVQAAKRLYQLKDFFDEQMRKGASNAE